MSAEEKQIGTVADVVKAYLRVIPYDALRAVIAAEFNANPQSGSRHPYKYRVAIFVGETKIAEGVGYSVDEACGGILDELRKKGGAG